MPAIPNDETETLIASNKVEETYVFDNTGKKLGTIFNFMVDKESGQVEYAVLQVEDESTKYYPIPWVALEYDKEQGGYVIDVDKEFLKQAPSYDPEETPRFTSDYGNNIDEAYGVGYEDEPDEEEEEDEEDEGPPPPRHGLENFVRHSPTAAVLGALVLGVVLGRIGLL